MTLDETQIIALIKLETERMAPSPDRLIEMANALRDAQQRRDQPTAKLVA